MSRFRVSEDKDYGLCVPAGMLISLRGVELMLHDFTRDCGKRPAAILMTQDCMARLCREAARNGGTFAEALVGRYPTFQGVPIDYIDPDDTFDIPIVEIEADGAGGHD